jgi:hypothetical protein
MNSVQTSEQVRDRGTRSLPPLKGGEAFKVHPLLPLPAAEEMARDLADPVKAGELVKYLNGRAELLRAEQEDPLYHKLRLPDSEAVDGLLCEPGVQLLYESGGKRAGKTEDGVPRFLKGCLAYGRAKRWAMQDNALSSVANLQQKFWDYLPKRIKALNNKRSALFRVHYSPQNGFDGLLILPNGCEVYFLNYTQNPSDFLGWELGKSLEVPLAPGVPDIGALLDENCTLAWLENIQLRCSTRGAKIHWMYSPQDGITPAIKQLKGNAKTTESREAELLSHRVNVPGLPKGHMPRVQRDEKKRLAIFYRFTQFNPFSGYSNPGGVKELCEGKGDRAYTMAHAYGYCEAVRGRAFPLFGEWNVIKAADVPAEGTNWLVTDPGGARNWFTLWGRVPPGKPMELYIYREWPDWESYGDWAVTSPKGSRLNGDRGPAQPTIGYGPAEYKKLFLRLEKVQVPEQVKAEDRGQRTEDGNVRDTGTVSLPPQGKETKTETEDEGRGRERGESTEELLKRLVVDGHHRGIIRRALAGKEGLEELRETIFERLIDPRAARNQSAADGKGIDLLTKLCEQNRDERTGQVSAGPMVFVPAPGLDIRDGISQINELLYFNQQEERVALINAPRLYVSERCRNLIWAMNNYSLPDDQERASDDACEDPVDCLRYLVTRGPRYILPGGKVKTTGGGSY